MYHGLCYPHVAKKKVRLNILVKCLSHIDVKVTTVISLCWSELHLHYAAQVLTETLFYSRQRC